jgi:hypothetical protein
MCSAGLAPPWWCFGIFALFFAWKLTFTVHYDVPVTMLITQVVLLVVTGGATVGSFFAQRQQYSLMSLLVFTSLVAVFCSLYACIGRSSFFIGGPILLAAAVYFSRQQRQP